MAFTHEECTASYSSAVTVKISGNATSKATVMSASLLTMQPCSKASNGNLPSSVSALITLLMPSSFPGAYGTPCCGL